MSVSMCVRKQIGKTTNIDGSNELLTDFKLYKDQLKPFGYKLMTIYITHSYCFQTWEDSCGHLHTSKHKCYIMTITSKALHQIKQQSWPVQMSNDIYITHMIISTHANSMLIVVCSMSWLSLITIIGMRKSDYINDDTTKQS